MRIRRIKIKSIGPGSAIYQCTSRIVDRNPKLGEIEKARFIEYMREYAAFCGVRILTFCIMFDHFHMLIEVLARPELPPSAEFVFERLECLSKTEISAVKARRIVETFRKAGNEEGERQFLDSITRRMWDLSEYMKYLKQQFSCWFNRTHNRKGTLWEERFKSVVVEGSRDAMGSVGAYIDMNPVRAGIVKDPRDYKWSGYGEAMAGEKLAQLGIELIATAMTGETDQAESPTEALRRYSIGFLGQNKKCDSAVSTTSTSHELSLPAATVATDGTPLFAELNNDGDVSISEYILGRVKTFTEGVVVGGFEFTNEIFMQFRDRFGAMYAKGPTRIRGLAGITLFALRDWRRGAFG